MEYPFTRYYFDIDFVDQMTQQKFEVPFVIKALYYIILLVIAISGYSLYVWYLNRNESPSRILNNLNGFLAFDGILISLLKFLDLVLSDYLSEESPIMCLLDIYRVPLFSLTQLIISAISVATILRYFFPQKYLNYSEQWSNKVFGSMILPISILHLLWVGKTCGMCHSDCVMNELFLVLKVSAPFFLLVVICVIIDSVWGWAQIFNRIRLITSCCNDSLVIHINSNATVDQTVTLKVDNHQVF